MSAGLVVGVLAAVLLAGLASWGVWAANRQRRVLGTGTYDQCIVVARTLGRHSNRIRTLLGLKWLCFIGGAWLLFRAWQGSAGTGSWPAGFGLLAIGLIQWGRQRVPPSILVLGGSTAEQLGLQAALRDAVLPFRPVSLLQSGELRTDMKIAGDCFRIDDKADWQKEVYAFCRALPVLVLDLRHMTAFVEIELEHIVASRYLYKTLVVAPPDAERRLVDAERRLNSHGPATPIVCVPDSGTAIGLLHYLLFERERVPGPSPEASIADLSHEWNKWRDGRILGPAAHRTAAAVVRVTPGHLAPFSYTPPDGWSMRVSQTADQYQVLFRPPEESGVRNLLKRRSRLDLMVFRYPEPTVPDEATLRQGTEFNLDQLGASVTRELIGQRCGAISHECFYRRGTNLGYLVRFIVHCNEYVVHWMTMDGDTMQRHQPVVDQFAETISG